MLFVSEDNKPAEWRIVYFIHAGVLVVTSAIFVMYVSDQPADFTKDPDAPKEEELDAAPLQRKSVARKISHYAMM